jgi:hypothetical protein
VTTEAEHIAAARDAHRAVSLLFTCSRTTEERLARAHIVDACAAVVRDLTGHTPSIAESLARGRDEEPWHEESAGYTLRSDHDSAGCE